MTGTLDGKRDFFISFNQADRVWATWIAWVLEEAGYSVFFQDWDFRGNFVLEMDRAHQQSHRTIAILSPDYLASRFTAPEWAARFKEDADSKHDLLIPVRVHECDPPGLLGPIVYADLVGLARDQARRQLLDRVAGIRLKPNEEPFYPGGPLPAAARSIPSEPRFPIATHNLPQPNRAFIGRTAELVALEQALANTGRTAITQPQAITGLGGIGKTQLALHYAYAHLGDYDLIRWLPAEKPEVLAVAYTGLAPALGLDPATPDQPALTAAIRAKLERLDRWLLVFDNATAPSTLDDYLPPTGTGDIVITSRHQDWADTAEMLELDVLPEDQAVALLLGTDADDPARRQDAAVLARDLGFLPLALAQARAFMRARKVDIVCYQRQFAAARPKVLAWCRPDASYPLSVAQTWQTSMTAAAEDCPAARELLELLAFLAPEAIPRELLGAAPETLPEGLSEELDRDSAIEALHRFSLIRADPATLAVHRLVQAVTRDGLCEATIKACTKIVVELLNAKLAELSKPPEKPANWPVIRALFPHALAVTEPVEHFGVGQKPAGMMLDILHSQYLARGTFYRNQGQLSKAELREQAAWEIHKARLGLKIREKVLGPEHPDTRTVRENLAALFGFRGGGQQGGQ